MISPTHVCWLRHRRLCGRHTHVFIVQYSCGIACPMPIDIALHSIPIHNELFAQLSFRTRKHNAKIRLIDRSTSTE